VRTIGGFHVFTRTLSRNKFQLLERVVHLTSKISAAVETLRGKIFKRPVHVYTHTNTCVYVIEILTFPTNYILSNVFVFFVSCFVTMTLTPIKYTMFHFLYEYFPTITLIKFTNFHQIHLLRGNFHQKNVYTTSNLSYYLLLLYYSSSFESS
jgi:hypothetical protein